MKWLLTLGLAAGLAPAFGQEVICARARSYMGNEERIFMSPDSPMTRGVQTIATVTNPEAFHLDPRYVAIYQNDRNERTNAWNQPLLMTTGAEIRVVSPNPALLNGMDIDNFLRYEQVIPKSRWVNGCIHQRTTPPAHYVMSVFVETLGNLVIDFQPETFAIVFFEDGSFSCLADPSHSCLQSQPIRIEMPPMPKPPPFEPEGPWIMPGE